MRTAGFPKMPDELAPDFASLVALLERYPYTQIPCRNDEGVPASYWTSDSPPEQALAASECPACPAISQCGAYSRRHPTESGVYATTTELQRKAKP
jgi:hypothetical protein